MGESMTSAIDRRSFLAGSAAVMAVNSAVALAQMEEPDFKRRYLELLARFQKKHPNVISDFKIVTVAGNAPPWIDTGLDLKQGEFLTILSSGQVYISRAARLSLLPRVVLWTRVGDANVFRPGSDTSSFAANGTGRFRLATLQGRWSTPQGEHSAPAAYEKIEGALDVLVIRWASDANNGVRLLAEFASGDALISKENKRLQAPLKMPRGFEELWYVGSGANFNQTTFDGEAAIAVRSELNGGIIRAPLNLPLTSDTYIEWEWRLHQLPSSRSEDVMPFHQYISVAIEFDDGQDLSWYWSATLDKDKHYVCPLPSWPGETHLVARTGEDDHGLWVREQRDVRADIDLALTKKPTRIVGVWLIALTVFGQRPASTDFRRIAVVSGSKKHSIFPA